MSHSIQYLVSMMTYGSLRSHGAREARRGLKHDLLLIVFDDPLRLADVLLLFIVYLDGSFERDEGNSSLQKVSDFNN